MVKKTIHSPVWVNMFGTSFPPVFFKQNPRDSIMACIIWNPNIDALGGSNKTVLYIDWVRQTVSLSCQFTMFGI